MVSKALTHANLILISGIDDVTIRVKRENGILRWAAFSPDGLYRYALGVQWGNGEELNFTLHNPSTATELGLDFTLRQSMAIAQYHGYGSMTIANRLAGGRSSKPADCNAMADPIGPANDAFLEAMWRRASDVIVGWGNCAISESRKAEMKRLMTGHPSRFTCLGYTVKNNPRHPGGQGRHRINPNHTWHCYDPL
jgi:hypothetical protein